MIINFRNLMCSGGGKDPVVEAISITSNGTYTATEGVDGYSPIDVSVLPKTEEKTVNITNNGQTVVDKSASVDGMTKVTVDVAVPIPEFHTEELTATENKVYTPTSDGYSKVTVNVPAPALNLQEKTTTVNGSVTPDNGYDGLSKVTVNVAGGAGEATVDFSRIGYTSADVSQFNDSVAYSEKKLKEWNPENTSANGLYYQDLNLVYAPAIDTSNVTNMESCFNECSNLTTVPKLDTSQVTDMNACFRACEKLTNLGGFTGLKVSLDLTAWGTSFPLTKQSLLNVIEGLAIMTDEPNPPYLSLGSDNIAILTEEEKAVATNKGWLLS